MTEDQTDFDVRMQLLHTLIRIRTQKGLRQLDVANAMGIGQPSVSEFERGEVSPKFETLQKYARAIGASIEININTQNSEEMNDA